MKIRLLTGMAGYDDEGRAFAHDPGAEIEVGAEVAKRLLDSDQAEPVASKGVERAERRTGLPKKAAA